MTDSSAQPMAVHVVGVRISFLEWSTPTDTRSIAARPKSGASASDCSVRAGCASRSVSDSVAGQSKETCIRSDVRLRLRVIEEVTREHGQPQLCERLG